VDDFIQVPTEAQGYRVSAQAMLEGARPLAKIKPIPSLALTLLCGHGTESALKALLAAKGLDSKVLSKSPYGHRLVNLWTKATNLGVKLPDPRPAWVEHLDRVHGYPHNLRYPLGFHAIVLPSQTDMLDGLEQVTSLANAIVP
jgi:hypothetical protein